MMPSSADEGEGRSSLPDGGLRQDGRVGTSGVAQRILVVEDDEATLEAVAEALSDLGCVVETCRDVEAARLAIDQREFDAVVTDLRMPGGDGLELCGRITGNRPDLPVVLMTAFGDTRVVSSAMRMGVVDFLQKPFSIDGLKAAIERAQARKQRVERVERLPSADETDDGPLAGTVGSSPVMRQLALRVRQASKAGCPVLITGETGTGKELVAHAVHALSERARGPFVALNCSALPAEMIESELFGHAHGAFTGAVRGRFGLFRAADGGTLFLDELGTMPLSLQSRLLRAMEAGAVRAVGTVDEINVDVRIVAATNAELRGAVAAQTFREDLLLRLAAFPIEIPPLRARGNDVMELARYFVSKLAPARENKGFSAEALRALQRYSWPGNVRELENCVQVAIVAAGDATIDVGDLPPRVRENAATTDHAAEHVVDLEAVERRHIERVLKEVGGNRSAASRKLGMNRVTLYRKLKRYQLD
jgi:DNA-binding NtrC family response regulator